VLGSLALDTLLLGQFVTIGRDTLAPGPNVNDAGLILFDAGVPTVQVVVCALAVSMPCLALLSVRYADLLPVLAYLPVWVELLLFYLGIVGLGAALLATFWFLSMYAALAFSLTFFAALLAIGLSLINMVAQRRRKRRGAPASPR
jgi:hypothetical protein